MTVERYRAPLWQGATASGCALDTGVPEADLFAATAPNAPHPDFAARAAIWRDHAAGLISICEARRRSAAVGDPGRPVTRRAPPTHRPRHARPSPVESRQYSGDMATTAARDDRLTPNAKAFLQMLRARCGKGRETIITKGTAGNIMSRSTRTIRRYLVDLVRFGYIELETRRNGRGMHLGLTVRVTALVMPFYEEAKGLARWLAEKPHAAIVPFSGSVLSGRQGVTLLAPINQSRNHLFLKALKTGRKTAWRIKAGEVAAPS